MSIYKVWSEIFEDTITELFHIVHSHKDHGYKGLFDFLSCQSCAMHYETMKVIQNAST